MWLMKGWSVGNYGLELQPFGAQTTLKRTEVAFLRTALGIGETCSTAAIYWLAGMLPSPAADRHCRTDSQRQWPGRVRLAGPLPKSVRVCSGTDFPSDSSTSGFARRDPKIGSGLL